MGYVELYNNDIVDLVNVGRTSSNFNESKGDYIKVEIFEPNSDTVLNTAYSNRLLLKYPNTVDKYYFGDYHFHPENTEMGFCTNYNHTDTSISKLESVPVGNGINDPLSDTNFKKQLDIYKDDTGKIYIKPNEILKLLNLEKGKYKLRIHFLRNVKSKLGLFLKTMKGNLIENGNFFAGLEATQTGDIDRSIGKNNFEQYPNPGFSPNVLCQNGLPGNVYNMRVTGVKPNTSYVFSCWVAWDEVFNGSNALIKFSYPSSSEELHTIPNTDIRGSFMNDEDDRIISHKDINGLNWFRLYSFVQTGNDSSGNLFLHLGETNQQFLPSINPLGKRYFTDLRFVEIESHFGSVIENYIKKLQNEEDNTTIFDYLDITQSSDVIQQSSTPVTVNQYVDEEPTLSDEQQVVLDMYNSIAAADIVSQNLAQPPQEETIVEDTSMTDNSVIEEESVVEEELVVEEEEIDTQPWTSFYTPGGEYMCEDGFTGDIYQTFDNPDLIYYPGCGTGSNGTYTGPIHMYHETGEYMAGSSHTEQAHPTLTPVNVQRGGKLRGRRI